MVRLFQFASNCVLGLAFAFAMLAHADSASGRSFKVLHSFSSGTDGCYPEAGLIIDGAGNLYGTTSGGAFPCNCGTVFEIPAGETEIPLYDFTCGNNGQGPDDTLLKDKAGNLYGGTIAGGSIGCGVIFEVTPTGIEKTLHDFTGQPEDGCTPLGTLIVDKDGNIFGTTDIGGKYNGGTVLELPKHGTEKILYSFCRRVHCPDGEDPTGVIADSVGNLYGATQSGGKLGCGNECGTVFEFAPDGTETVLYKFKGPPDDGNLPNGDLIIDQSGDFLGTLFNGGRAGCYGNAGCGAVFKLAPDGTETVLHFFTGRKGDGANPNAGLIADGAGNLYGTAEFGGGLRCTVITAGCGIVFELAPDGTETVLHSFGTGDRGALPAGGLVADKKGNLYGTTSKGGVSGFGNVFEITP